MVCLTSTFLAATAVAGALAALAEMGPHGPGPRPKHEIASRSTPNQQGTNNGYFYQFWSQGGGDVTYTNGAGGQYSVNWQNVDDFTAGKGWQQATGRTITFSGSFNPGSNGYLAVYTWSGSGETYILENFGPYNPGSGGTLIGTLNSDGGTYDIYRVYRSSTYVQYWSIRRQKRSSGTVTTSNHYNWYNAHGLLFNPSTNATYQIVSTEGFGSTGSASITVGETTTGSSPPPSTSSGSSGGGGGGGNCAALYAQCGGQGFSGPSCCAAGTCKFSNTWYSQCLN